MFMGGCACVCVCVPEAKKLESLGREVDERMETRERGTKGFGAVVTRLGALFKIFSSTSKTIRKTYIQ